MTVHCIIVVGTEQDNPNKRIYTTTLGKCELLGKENNVSR